jgi:cell division protein FtsB
MKWLGAALLLVILGTQYRLWLSDSGIHEIGQLQQSISEQQARNDRLAERNRQMAEEVRDLKQGTAAIEERARSDLGLINADENYYQVITTPGGTAAPQTAPAAPADATAPAKPQRTGTH